MRYAVIAHPAVLLLCSTLATPIQAQPVPPGGAAGVRAVRTGRPAPSPRPLTVRPPAPRPLAASALYSRRSRRLVQSYLRLKVLEMRERDLDLARKVIERKLGIGSILGETRASRVR